MDEYTWTVVQLLLCGSLFVGCAILAIMGAAATGRNIGKMPGDDD